MSNLTAERIVAFLKNRFLYFTNYQYIDKENKFQQSTLAAEKVHEVH